MVGNTPLLPIASWNQAHPRTPIFAKCEWRNPGGSVKDRAALNMIREALKSGELGPGKTLLDATSGNTGIAYAMLCASLGIPVELCVPANCSQERKVLLAAYGAVVHYTDPLAGSDGAILKCRELAERYPEKYFVPDQYNNDNNWKAHYLYTANEIWKQTEGQITHFVCCIGTSGTLMGNGRRLRELNPNVQIVEVEPAGPIHGIEGLKHMATSIMPGIYQPGFADRKISMDTDEAYQAARELCRQGIGVGMSAGAAYAAARRLARELTDAYIVAIFCDGAERYLSTALFH
jgi:cysteine synthase B